MQTTSYIISCFIVVCCSVYLLCFAGQLSTADSSTFAIKEWPGLKPHVAVNLISHWQQCRNSLHSSTRVVFRCSQSVTKVPTADSSTFAMEKLPGLKPHVVVSHRQLCRNSLHSSTTVVFRCSQSVAKVPKFAVNLQYKEYKEGQLACYYIN